MHDLIEGGIEQIGTKIGVFGGTFDPVHNGHCELVRQFKSQCNLDSVIIIPASIPPHKPTVALSDFEHRFNMLSLAFSGVEGLFVSRLETLREGPSYTIDTLNQLKEVIGPDCQWYLVLGEDAYAEIHTWKAYKAIPQCASIIVFNREYAPDALDESSEKPFLDDFFRDNDASGKKPIYLKMPAVNISSTGVRTAIAEKQKWKHFVPTSVASYIENHGLYKQ